MPQIIDPRQGVQRTRNLMTKLAAKAMARKGYKSKVGTFGKVAAGGARPRNLRPNRGPGSGLARGAARPGGFGSFFDGLGPDRQQPPPSYLNTAPVAAPIPMPPIPDVSTIEDESGTWEMPANFNPEPEPGMSVWGLPLEETAPDPNRMIPTGDRKSGYGRYSQAAPSAPITAPGGLIPLGGGIYYDPVTGETFGGQAGSTTNVAI